MAPQHSEQAKTKTCDASARLRQEESLALQT